MDPKSHDSRSRIDDSKDNTKTRTVTINESQEKNPTYDAAPTCFLIVLGLRATLLPRCPKSMASYVSIPLLYLIHYPSAQLTPTDQTRLLTHLAPHLRNHPPPRPLDPASPPSPHLRNPHTAHPRPPRLPHCHPPHGQAQAHLGPLNRLRRLCRRHKLHLSARHGAEEVPEDVLSAQYAPWVPEANHHGRADG